MNIRTILFYLGLAFVTAGFANAEEILLRNDTAGDPVRIDVTDYSSDRIEFEVRLAGIERLEAILEGRRWDRVEIPGGGYELDLGAPEVPHFTRLLAIPARSGVRAEFEALETTTLTGIELMPAQGKDLSDLEEELQPVIFDMAAYSRDAFYPEEEVMTDEPALMRGIRLVGVRMHPVRYNPVTNELCITHNYRVTVYFEGMDDRNAATRPLRPMSRSWAKLMQGTVINYDNLDLDLTETGSYLIVCENDAYLLNSLLPRLVDWKKRKGHEVVIETFTPGASNYDILAIIQNAYDSWEVPPEYVLLFGDTDGDYALPGWTIGWPPQDHIDHPYSQLDGGDILADVAVGRIPASDDYQAIVMINKVLYYEKDPYVGNSDWYHQGCLMAASGASGISTVQTNRWIKTRMVWHEYTRIDTFWYYMGGSVYNTTTTAINNGVSILNYRGYGYMGNFYVGDIYTLTNGRKLPFNAIITCGTGGFAGSESFMEAFVEAGTPTTPQGAIACIGMATYSTHTRQNNTIDMGIFAGIFDEGLTQAGNALNRGKLELYNTYQTHDPSSVEDFSKYAALAGDPGLEIFNGAIRYLDCAIPGMVEYGENELILTVSEPGVGPVENAIVCLYRENDIQEVCLTDNNGQAVLPLNPSSPGNVKVTITKQCFFPIVDSLDVIQAAVTLGYDDHVIDDDNSGSSSGDGDGVLNPGETVEIALVLMNFGSTTTATGVTARATTEDDFATMIDAFETFPNITPGATGSSADDFDLSVSSNCPEGHIIHLDLTNNAVQGSWDGMLDLEVVSYAMTFIAAYASGGDSLLSPGETADFNVVGRNMGGKEAASLTATLTSLSPYVSINDNSASFGTVGIGSFGSCSGDPFNLTAAEETPPGSSADLEILYSSSTGATQTDTITIVIGIKSQTDPQGPDEYGYYSFDNTDLNYAQAPVYEWVEINPAYGGSGTRLPINDPSENLDASLNVPLPFTFQYYGEETDEITVCSNGWISTWANNSFTDFRNYPIPSCIGPNGMIAAFWDDLATWSEGHVYILEDTTNHRFIIEWSRMKSLGWPSPEETFEIILFDPAYYPTSTGDGPILFQYETVTENYGLDDDNPYSTVGIERPDQQDGIEIVYWNTYEDPATAPLVSGRAYMFTTDLEYILPGTPELFIELTYNSGSPVPPGGGNLNYGVFLENQGTQTVSYDAWIDISYEGGPPTTILQRAFMNFLPGWSVNRPDMTFPVPWTYPAGNYTMTGRVGEYPHEVWEESGFSWVKLGDDAVSGFVPWVPDGVANPFDEVTTIPMEVTPQQFILHPVYPNPFNPSTTFRIELPVASWVTLQVYDIGGRLVESPLQNAWRPAGYHEVMFDASELASGVYVYRLQMSGSGTTPTMVTGKMVLMR
jgi:hypothetical protein